MKKLKIDGVSYELNFEMLTNDMETLRLFAETQEDPAKAYLFPIIVKRILGEDGYKKACDRYRTEKGNVPLEPFQALFEEIVKQSTEVKNS